MIACIPTIALVCQAIGVAILVVALLVHAAQAGDVTGP